MKLRFPLLAAAVEHYERTAAEHRRLWDAAISDVDVMRASEAEAQAERLVREAFCQDERNPNCRGNSMLLDMATAKRWAKLTLR